MGYGGKGMFWLKQRFLRRERGFWRAAEIIFGSGIGFALGVSVVVMKVRVTNDWKD